MPPKSKFTKQEIIAAALAVVEREGMEALTARSLAAELGSSPRPVFTVFNNMEEVQTEVFTEAKRLYNLGVEQALCRPLAFKEVGGAYVAFAARYPKLFQMLFMRESEEVPDIQNVLCSIEDGYENILASIRTGYGLSEAHSLALYRHMWIYCHGVAVLIATGVCKFSGGEISQMMTEVCAGLIARYRGEER